MARPAHRIAARQYLPESKLEDLVNSLRRLANHRGLVRKEITSPMLLRLLPGPRRGDPFAYESDLRRRLVEADLDLDRITYLLSHVEQEIGVAHARLAG
ncbi:hypothetical protein [Methylobacterium sp. Leaf118]|uniref:hypothetical protein n=1 Tax=Methylobacterium sp. Leaf118 TaxID=2876562 RepID=UPI001E325F69|nr:hypothetical protein [Methylobacterium sp. Leaf118]